MRGICLRRSRSGRRAWKVGSSGVAVAFRFAVGTGVRLAGTGVPGVSRMFGSGARWRGFQPPAKNGGTFALTKAAPRWSLRDHL